MAYDDEVLAWRAARLARLTSENGWLTIVGKFDLRPGRNAIPDVGEVLFERGVATFDGREVAEGRPIRAGDLVLELLRRSDGPKIRVKNACSPTRLNFGGIEYFRIEPAWRKVARFKAFERARVVDLEYEGVASERFESPGACVFEHDGRELCLEPVLDRSQPRLYVLFADETNRDETYGAGRFLYAPLPEAGRTVLDFNQAFNPPCAFNPWVSCPIVSPQNRLGVRVEAGEKRPRDKEDVP
jgi:uncharacterized protein (DUF1684 family)